MNWTADLRRNLSKWWELLLCTYINGWNMKERYKRQLVGRTVRTYHPLQETRWQGHLLQSSTRFIDLELAVVVDVLGTWIDERSGYPGPVRPHFLVQYHLLMDSGEVRTFDTGLRETVELLHSEPIRRNMGFRMELV